MPRESLWHPPPHSPPFLAVDNLGWEQAPTPLRNGGSAAPSSKERPHPRRLHCAPRTHPCQSPGGLWPQRTGQGAAALQGGAQGFISHVLDAERGGPIVSHWKTQASSMSAPTHGVPPGAASTEAPAPFSLYILHHQWSPPACII